MPEADQSILRVLGQGLLTESEKSAELNGRTAVARVPTGMELAVSVDTLVSGVHFPEGALPTDIGHKALAVNLSDLAAMGAEPAWALLSLTLPAKDESWLRAFGEGFRRLASRYAVTLKAAVLNLGPLAVTVQICGHVPCGKALTRGGARPGNQVYVTGSLGDAGLALAHRAGSVCVRQADIDEIERRLSRPEPRVQAGIALRDIASAAIDISDGLVSDLGHLLRSSRAGAVIRVDRLPLSEALDRNVAGPYSTDLALSAGDDYELCFTVPRDRVDLLEEKKSELGCTVTCIGHTEQACGLRCISADGTLHMPRPGYEHFA